MIVLNNSLFTKTNIYATILAYSERGGEIMAVDREFAKSTQTLHLLREQMEKEPWIHFRNKLISELVAKRRELGITQTDIASAMNVPSTSITRFESMAIMKKGGAYQSSKPNDKVHNILRHRSRTEY